MIRPVNSSIYQFVEFNDKNFVNRIYLDLKIWICNCFSEFPL